MHSKQVSCCLLKTCCLLLVLTTFFTTLEVHVPISFYHLFLFLNGVFNPRYFDLMHSVSSIKQYSNSKVSFLKRYDILYLKLFYRFCRWWDTKWCNEIFFYCAISHKITLFLNILNLFLFSYLYS